MLFVGEYKHTLDAKNRIFIPAKYRDALGEAFYITRKMNKACLAIYTEEAMEEIGEKVNQIPDSYAAEIKEFLFSKCVIVSSDSNGRIVIPPELLRHAGIEKNAVIIGAGNHLQIWSDVAWAEEEANRDMTLLRSKLASIGL